MSVGLNGHLIPLLIANVPFILSSIYLTVLNLFKRTNLIFSLTEVWGDYALERLRPLLLNYIEEDYTGCCNPDKSLSYQSGIRIPAQFF
jgi:hypothetical protein